MVASPCTGASAQSVDLVEHGLAGRLLCATTRLERRPAAGASAAELMATAVTERKVAARPASSTMLANTDAARGEKKVTMSSGARLERGARGVRQGRLLARVVEHETLHLEARRRQQRGKIGRDLAARHLQQGAVLRLEALAHQIGQGRAVARRRGDGAEAQPFGRAGGGVADGKDRPAALLAGVGQRARAIGAGEQHGLAGGERGGELRRGCRNSAGTAARSPACGRAR